MPIHGNPFILFAFYTFTHLLIQHLPVTISFRSVSGYFLFCHHTVNNYSMQPSIQALKLPALQGYLWVTEGVRLVLRNPVFSITVSLGSFMITMILMMLPTPVNVIAYLLWPALTLCILNCFRLLDTRQPATPDALISGFTHPNIRAFFILGGFYFIIALAIRSILILLDLPLPDLKIPNPDQQSQVLSEEERWQMMRFTLINLLLNIPFFMLSWFAPYLVGWRSTPPLQGPIFQFYRLRTQYTTPDHVHSVTCLALHFHGICSGCFPALPITRHHRAAVVVYADHSDNSSIFRRLLSLHS